MYMVCDLKTENVIFREDKSSLLDGVHEFHWNDTNAITFYRMGTSEDYRQCKLAELFHSDLYLDVIRHMQASFGDLRELNDWQEIAKAITEDVVESSAFETELHWNDCDIQMATRRVMNGYIHGDFIVKDLRNVEHASLTYVVDCAWNAIDYCLGRDEESLTDRRDWDSLVFVDWVAEIAIKWYEKWQSMTEEERDDACYPDLCDAFVKAEAHKKWDM